MTEPVKLAKTARDRMLEPYEASGTEHEFRTTPILSVNQLRGEVVNYYAASGAPVAFVKFMPQKVAFFRTGDDESCEYGSGKVPASEAETNLQKGGSTDGARSMAIEGIAIASNGTLIKYIEDADAATALGWGQAPTDDTLLAALRGNERICDPFGVLVPAQLQSPYLLEDALFQDILRLSTIELTTDSSKPFKMGLAAMFPGFAGSSYLRSNGQPAHGNVFRFPEGISWNKDGERDSDLKVVLELHRPIVLPISVVTPPGGAVPVAPKKVFQRVAMTLHGMSIGDLGSN